MRPKLLVVSTVHPADDPRIRRKLIGTLEDDWAVTYATKGRGPVDQEAITWLELPGNRIVRWLRAGQLLLASRYDVAALHDPELVPLGLLASLRRRKVVFDVHENVPAQLRTKEWVPRLLRRPLATVAGWMLRIAEKRLAITLAESGYMELFRSKHPVFPNYLVGDPPTPRDVDPSTGIVYLGDINEVRGLALATEAAGRAGAKTLTLMGRCTPDFRAKLQTIASANGLELNYLGFVTSDRALEIAAGAVMGLSPLLDVPNYRGSLPTKVLEYLAVGVPTLASDLAGTREVVEHEPGVLLIPPGDLDEWTSSIASALADPALRTAARSGVARIRETYLWPADEVKAFYRALLD